MARKARIIGSVVDVRGRPWAVREYRPTAHGFSVAIGWPQGEARGRGGRGVAVAPTQGLAEYLATTRLRDTDFPIGGDAITWGSPPISLPKPWFQTLSSGFLLR